jgi:enamine deaminase RidA (YjgF/YER057c/UK114 family)
MSRRTAINSEKGLRSPLFSQAIVCNGMVYVSGNIGMDYGKMELIEGSVADRTVCQEDCGLLFAARLWLTRRHSVKHC